MSVSWLKSKESKDMDNDEFELHNSDLTWKMVLQACGFNSNTQKAVQIHWLWG